MTEYNFSSKFRLANIFSIIVFTVSIILISFKGLNYESILKEELSLKLDLIISRFH